jgi:hypothetical protein
MSILGLTPEPEEQFFFDKERIRAGGEITIPEELAKAAAKGDWPEELLKRALALGAKPAMLIAQIEIGILADQAERFIAQQELRETATALSKK